MPDWRQDYLRRVGREPRPAADGQDALGIAATWRPHLAVPDLMPPGVSGPEVASARARDTGRSCRS